MVYFLAVTAALSNALTTVLQRLGVETAPKETTLRLSLITYAIRRKVWLAGFALMICGFLLQFTALHFGRLSTVQPILALELPFLVLILAVWFGHKLTWREWSGSFLAAGGLAMFLVAAEPGGGQLQPRLSDWLFVAGAVVGVCALTAALGTTGPLAFRAAMFGVSAAVMFAFTAAIMKEMNSDIADGWAGVFTTWPPYAIAVCGLAGVFLVENAFHVGPITASQAMLVIIDPLASIAIGISLFGDQLQTGGARGPVEAIGLLALVVGVFYLARSPLVAGVRTEEDSQEHILSSRRHVLSSRKRKKDRTDVQSQAPGLPAVQVDDVDTSPEPAALSRDSAARGAL